MEKTELKKLLLTAMEKQPITITAAQALEGAAIHADYLTACRQVRAHLHGWQQRAALCGLEDGCTRQLARASRLDPAQLLATAGAPMELLLNDDEIELAVGEIYRQSLTLHALERTGVSLTALADELS